MKNIFVIILLLFFFNGCRGTITKTIGEAIEGGIAKGSTKSSSIFLTDITVNSIRRTNNIPLNISDEVLLKAENLASKSYNDIFIKNNLKIKNHNISASKVINFQKSTSLLTNDGVHGIKSTGKHYLLSTERDILLQDTALLEILPPLKKALEKNIPIKKYLQENPSSSFIVGRHLMLTDRKTFAHYYSKVKLRNPLNNIYRRKYKKEIRNEIDSIIDKIPNKILTSKKITQNDIEKIKQTVNSNALEEVTIDNSYVYIKLKSANYDISVKIDIQSILLKSTATTITYEVLESKFTPTPKNKENQKYEIFAKIKKSIHILFN